MHVMGVDISNKPFTIFHTASNLNQHLTRSSSKDKPHEGDNISQWLMEYVQPP
jgi:hypothetical protein